MLAGRNYFRLRRAPAFFWGLPRVRQSYASVGWRYACHRPQARRCVPTKAAAPVADRRVCYGPERVTRFPPVHALTKLTVSATEKGAKTEQHFRTFLERLATSTWSRSSAG